MVFFSLYFYCWDASAEPCELKADPAEVRDEANEPVQAERASTAEAIDCEHKPPEGES